MLVIRDLVKKYGNFTAVDHLNMHVERGQIYGFIGPNGAGKTTTMRMWLPCWHPHRGMWKWTGWICKKILSKSEKKSDICPTFSECMIT